MYVTQCNILQQNTNNAFKSGGKWLKLIQCVLVEEEYFFWVGIVKYKYHKF